MKRSIKKKSFLFVIMMILTLVSLNSTAVFAKKIVKVSASKVDKGVQFSFSEMPSAAVSNKFRDQLRGLQLHWMQNFDISPDNKYVFAVSTCEDETGKTGSILICCDMPETPGPDAFAKSKWIEVFKGYGHSEAVAVTQPAENIYNIWMICTPVSGKKSYGTEAVRVTYEEGIGITKTVKFTNFTQAGVKVSKGKVKPAYLTGTKKSVTRLSLAADTTSNKIAFRVSMGNDNVYYVFYNLQMLEAAADKIEDGGFYNMKNAASYENAIILCTRTPLASFQSFCISDKNLYMCGGNFGKGAQIDIYPYVTTTAKKIQVQKLKAVNISKSITMPSLKLTTKNAVYNNNKVEIEGIKTRVVDGKRYFYLSFCLKGAPLSGTMKIYRIAA